ncbi:MAG: hypothetical protein MUF54_08150 [Polyangiaceae bacterium]|nr:hypothetical protein [Polyangiaceae bacterium]
MHEGGRRLMFVATKLDCSAVRDFMSETSAQFRIVERAQRIAGELVARLHGRQFEHHGTSIAVFDEPTAAVRFAFAFHDSLADLSTSACTVLSARVGVHRSPVITENSARLDRHGSWPGVALQGPSVPQLMAIVQLAQPGQTLLSGSAWEAVASFVLHHADLPAGTRWMHHGTFAVRGHSQLVELVEVGIAGISAFRPPPANGLIARRVSQRPKPRPRRRRALLLLAAGGVAVLVAILWTATRQRASSSGDAEQPVAQPPKPDLPREGPQAADSVWPSTEASDVEFGSDVGDAAGTSTSSGPAASATTQATEPPAKPEAFGM